MAKCPSECNLREIFIKELISYFKDSLHANLPGAYVLNNSDIHYVTNMPLNVPKGCNLEAVLQKSVTIGGCAKK